MTSIAKPANWNSMTPAQQQAWITANVPSATQISTLANSLWGANNTNAAGDQNLTQYMASQVTNPTVPNDAELTPVLQNTSEAYLNQTGQNMQATNQNTLQPNAANPITPTQVAGTQNDPNAATSMVNPNGSQYQATQVSPNVPQGTTTDMNVRKEATVQGQLENIYANMTPDTTPPWAQAAVNTVSEYMAARGLKANSSISNTALFGAVQNSALNIAAADAQTYFQADMASYTASQQMNLQNLQNRQQAMLSDQAASNAAKQFNASSEQQTQQFMANLVSNINEQNANRIQAANLSNQDKDLAAQQFNSAQEFQRQQFNAQNQFAIDQSNVLWRRELNTANTAAVNAANQFNVQNKFNLSTTAMNNLWQQLRDEAAWAFTASENQKNRDYNLAIVSNNMSWIEDMSDTKWYEELGGLAASIFFTS